MKNAGRLFAALLIAGVTTAAFAGGPLYTFDPENRIPFAWSMSRWPSAMVPVFTDQGNLGILNNTRARRLVGNSNLQWSNVPTTSFRARTYGDFSLLGLGNVDYSTVQSVLGEWNGGGIHIVFDDDGSIMENFFGVPGQYVLGITNIDYIETGTPEILEAWIVLSGPGVHANDPNGVGFQGVVTHEMGHALNLGHSQGNGAVENFAVYDSPMPEGCGAPFYGGPDARHVETMYPISTPEPGLSGEYMGTVDRIDDQAALSDLYPGPGYPENRGTIRGVVRDAFGTPVAGIDIIARNVADPFNDFTSYITGQVTKGWTGPDGTYELNGLTPGARYIVYTDNLLIGAFSTERVVVLPGPEEYWNGAMESGAAAQDDRCAWVTVASQPGVPVTADITFNRYDGAPQLITAPFAGNPTDITADGSVVVGALSDINGPIFRWNVNTGFAEDVGGFRIGTPSISDDGTKIASTTIDTDGVVKAAIHENGAWTIIPSVPGSTPCAQDGIPVANSAWDISGDGSTVVGMNYGDTCFRGGIRAFKWTAATGIVVLPKVSSFNLLSRANGVNYDGSVIVGHDESTTGQWRGVFWKDGVAKLMTRNGLNVNPAVDVSRDGELAVGQSALASSNNAWRYSTPGSAVQMIGSLSGMDSATTNAISDDHGVITGWTTSSTTNEFAPAIWTAGLRWSNLNKFLTAQGVYLGDVFMFGANAISGDGHNMTGTIASNLGNVPFVLKSPTSVVCHAPAENPTERQTTIVDFPHGLDVALAAGDTLGPCQCSASAPAGIPALTIEKPAEGMAQLNWSAVGAATGYDLSRGSLSLLKSTGDFYLATTDCVENDLTGTTHEDADTPAAGDGFWYLIRPVNCGGRGTFDSGAPSQVAPRDERIQFSSSACP